MWGDVELEPEVTAWVRGLGADDFGQVHFHIDLLAREGPLLGEPYTRQLDGKLRELRFRLGRQQYRITYFIATGRRIVLLTVFRKTRQQERSEIERAQRVMQACIDEAHTTEDESW